MPPRKSKRIVQIRTNNPPWREIVAVVEAPSLKAALQHHYDEALKSKGWSDPIYKGNTLSCSSKSGEVRMWTATEAR